MTDRPHPLRREAVLIMIIALAASIATKLGVNADVVADWADEAVSLVSILVTAGWIVGRGEPQVTPVSDPRDDDGASLVRTDQA